VAQDEALRLKNKFKGVGSVAGMAAVARRAARITGPDAAVDHSVDAEDARPSGGGGSSKAHSTPVRKRRYNVEEHQRKALPSSSSVANRKAQAQVIGDERSITFGASASLFYGRQGQQGRRKYPHELDQSVIVAAISNPVRHSRVSEELRAARLRKYDDDVDRMAYAERLHRTTLLPQADGELLRFGRLDAAWDGRLQYSAPMHKRGQIATWNYRKGFFVLCEGLLHEFGDSSLTSPLLAAWPVLGCSMRKCAASHKLFPYAFELTINSYFVSDSILASTEFACDSPEAVKKWMDAIERAALAVSKLFKDSNDREVHAAQATRAIQKYAPPVTPGSSGQPIAARAGGATPKSRSTSKNKKDRPSVRV